MKKLLSLVLLLSTFSAAAQSEKKISVDYDVVENEISPLIYGACIEDVNHECYGGIYAQRLYGESFEEPSSIESFPGFTKYEGVWSVVKGVIGVSCSRGCKLVWDTPLGDGSFETDIRFDNDRGRHGGVAFRISEPGPGFNNFKGYTVSLSSVGGYINLCKHDHNEVLLAEKEISHHPYQWARLKVCFEGDSISVFLDGKLQIAYRDTENPYLEGKVALRNLQSDTYYKRLVINSDGKSQKISFKTPEKKDVSNQWKACFSSDAKPAYRHSRYNPAHGKYCQMFSNRHSEGSAGVSNMGLNGWGIPARKGEDLEGYVYLRGRGDVTIDLESEDGTCYASASLGEISSKWKKYGFKLTPAATDPKCRMVVRLEGKGRAFADMAMLHETGDRLKNGFMLRSDVADALIDEGLKIMRYGGTMINVPDYRFKNMVGPEDQRPPYRGHWYWWASNGFGIEEFAQICESCGFQCAVAVNILEDPQDMADMVEYLNGPEDSKWGSLRARNGHPKPYGIKYFELGNEEVIIYESDAAYDFYIQKFNAIHDAMKAVDPSIEFVCSVMWRPNLEEDMHRIFDGVDGKCEYWDYHPWADPLVAGQNCDRELCEMEALFHKWNPESKMKCIIFEENGDTHNMRRTLGHVTIKNAVRRHGEFVHACCAANALQPYLQNDNSWSQGHVFLTPDKVWGQPHYYAQKMASDHHRSLRVKTTVENCLLDVTATKDPDCKDLVLHIANIRPNAVTAVLDVKSFGKYAAAEVWTLTSDSLSDINPVDDPEHIIPMISSIPAASVQQYTFPPYSYTMIVLSR